AVRLPWFWGATAVVEVWVLVSWLAGVAPLARGLGVAAFNIAMLCYVAWLAYRNQHLLQSGLMRVTALTSLLLVAHWATVYFIIDREPAWFDYGFMLGTVLVLTQYFSLLAALLLSFQQRLLEAESKALDMAFQDPLTGLNNQRYVSTLFDKVLALATRPHQLLAVFYIDLDNFKPINDSAGHKVGDEVLKTVALRLRQATRSTDICARVGGDEFVVLCTQLERAEQAHDIAGKLLDTLTSPITVEGKAYVLGASVGVSLYPLHGTSLPQLLEYADSAMYEVKRSGKKGYRIYAPEAADVQL
ncbi:GGDEF domain-containing protein, partial [Chitinimonas sp.]|uniref:GGDEF domain-containing protein n=1 Tax=Chitinimonas sp. TaxID=1934313 RepID=UPI002F94A53B